MSSAKRKEVSFNRFLNGLFTACTFPGIVVHEYTHRLFCDLAGVKVYKVRYFQFDSATPGYVIHAPIDDMRNAFFVSFGPFLVNSILCMLLTFPMTFPYTILKAHDPGLIFTFLAWAGFTIGMHAFPSETDAEGFVAAVAEKENALLFYLCAVPLYGITLFTNRILSHFLINLFYAVAISGLVPNWLLDLWVWLTQ